MLADVARFRPADDPAVIEACFACPYCLRAPEEVLLDIDIGRRDGGEVLCSCERCAALWRVALDADQSLRMAVAPPPTLVLRAVR